MEWNDEYNKRLTRKVAEIGVNVGDYIEKRWPYSGNWYEVTAVFRQDETCHGAVVIVTRHLHLRTEYTFFNDIKTIHRKDDPWDFQEARSICTSEGIFGYKESSDPLPDKFHYHGTFRLKPWLWNYCGRNVMASKSTPPLEEFLELAQVPGNNISRHDVSDIIEKLKRKRIRGWYPHCTREAEQQFNKSIFITLESKNGTESSTPF